MTHELLSGIDIEQKESGPVRVILPIANGTHRLVTEDGRRAYLIRTLPNGSSEEKRGEFDVFDLNLFHVTEVEGFLGEQKEQQIALLKSLGNKIEETENPDRFIAYKKREEF